MPMNRAASKEFSSRLELAGAVPEQMRPQLRLSGSRDVFFIRLPPV
jgi:hypothetical protein